MRIYIHNSCYSVDEIISDNFQPQEDWKVDLQHFIREWFNDSLYVVAHTSGSTGVPKLMKLLKSDMLASAQLTNSFFDITSKSKLLLCLSVGYIAGKMMIVRALHRNCDLLVIKPESIPQISQIHNITLVALVPMQMHEILNSGFGFDNTENVIIGGAAVSSDIKQRIGCLKCNFFESYGMTETISHIALKHLNGLCEAFETLGDIIVSQDDRDCLVIETPHLTVKKIVTNDIVRLIDNKTFIWLGRNDYVINSGGIKFSPETIEKKLEGCIDHRFFITSKPDEKLGERIVLIIEDRNWTLFEVKNLYALLHQRLLAYEIPKEIIFIEKLNETASHKIIRKI